MDRIVAIIVIPKAPASNASLVSGLKRDEGNEMRALMSRSPSAKTASLRKDNPQCAESPDASGVFHPFESRLTCGC
jgi:hypothetical protein